MEVSRTGIIVIAGIHSELAAKNPRLLVWNLLHQLLLQTTILVLLGISRESLTV
jgi:hypothetical protein